MWHKGAKACLPPCSPGKPAWHQGARSCLPHHHMSRHVSGGAQLPSPRAIKAHSVVPTGSTATPAGLPDASAPTTIWNGGFNLDPFTAQQLERYSVLSANLNKPPGFLIPIYKAAGRRFHIQWQILAAINAIETNYGRNLSVSPAGAIGWMQFMPDTWIQWGMAADGASRPNPYDPRDAVFSAARYLDASGGAKHLRQALFAYNHAWWYVDAVLWRAQLITDQALGKHARQNGYSLPLDLRYMSRLGRTDDGVDIEDAPDGVAVYSITPGVVTAVASDPSGFGPEYPVILVTKGPLAGQYIYYGHVAASLVRVGQQVLAGQPIAVMGHTGDAAWLGHGHIEIGFSDASGDPLNHHGPMAWTPSGDAMRRVLTALTQAFLIAREGAAHRSELAAARRTHAFRSLRQPGLYELWSALRTLRMRFG
jgi:Peptidase family M23/Transglycosylase SLT domain